MERTLELLRECGVFYLATMDGDQPRVRPFGAACIFDGKLYITTSNKKEVFAQMTANPKIEISGMAGKKWIRLSAEVVRDERREARTAMLEDNIVLRTMYSEDDGNMEVLYLKNAKVSLCSFEAPQEDWEF